MTQEPSFSFERKFAQLGGFVTALSDSCQVALRELSWVSRSQNFSLLPCEPVSYNISLYTQTDMSISVSVSLSLSKGSVSLENLTTTACFLYLEADCSPQDSSMGTS